MSNGSSASAVLTADYLRSILDYDSETGVLSWKPKDGGDGRAQAWNGQWAGRRAGCLHWKGYRQLQLLGKKWPAALVAWIHAGGEFPPYCIDHKNGVRDDDRLSNLRPATASQNSANRKVVATSGVKGAHLGCRPGRFAAEITTQGQRTKLGTYETADEAHAAYRDAAVRLHGEFARLS